MNREIRDIVESMLHAPAREAVVHKTVDSPTDRLYVKLVTEKQVKGWPLVGPCRWEPRIQPADPSGVEIRYPAANDYALVVFSDADDPVAWVVSWSPRSYG